MLGERFPKQSLLPWLQLGGWVGPGLGEALAWNQNRVLQQHRPVATSIPDGKGGEVRGSVWGRPPSLLAAAPARSAWQKACGQQSQWFPSVTCVGSTGPDASQSLGPHKAWAGESLLQEGLWGPIRRGQEAVRCMGTWPSFRTLGSPPHLLHCPHCPGSQMEADVCLSWEDLCVPHAHR